MDEVTREMREYRDDLAAFDEVRVDYTDPSSWTAEEWERVEQIDEELREPPWEPWRHPGEDGAYWIDTTDDDERIPF